MRCTVRSLGLLKAVSRYSPGMSTLVWIGREGSSSGAPCGVSAPVAGSILNAFAKCLSPAMPAEPGPPLLVTTYKYCFDGCGQAYWILAGVDTVSRLTSAASSTSTL